jgi:dephospho-CoA kinase
MGGASFAATGAHAVKDRPLVVCFAGRIGSGKTSVTRALATQLGWRRAAFGDYLRDRIVREGGDANDRQVLQDLGQRLVDNDAELFCRDVLAHADYVQGESLLVDGIRHVAMYRLVVSIVAPVESRLIYLSADIENVRNRVDRRSGEANDLARAEAHRVEAELSTDVPAVADAIIDSNQTFDSVVSVVISMIAGFESGPHPRRV